MKKRSVGFAMTILIIGNLVAVLSDALIKTMGKDAAIFQFVFFRQLSAVIILLPFCLTATKQSFFNRLKMAFCASACVVIRCCLYGDFIKHPPFSDG